MVFLSSNVLVTFLLTLFVSSSSYSVSAIPTLSTRDSRTYPPNGAIVVKPSGAASGEFTSIQAAVNSLPNNMSPAVIFIYAGIYYEQVTVSRSSVTIYGETTDTSSYTSNSVTIIHSGSAGEAGSDVATATLIANSPDFKIYNVNIKNTFGRSYKNGQALALSAGATQQAFYGCGFYSYQDTILAESGKQYYGRCYIEGAVDFIFGQHAQVFFQKNTIASIGRGSITASGPDNSTDGIFVINQSKIVLGTNAAPGTSGGVFLGRPWTKTARVVYSSCNLGAHINALGWTGWSTTASNTDSVLFGEYNNKGPGALGKRASFATKLSSNAGYTIKATLGYDYRSWVDPNYL